jgi:flagellar hook-length control protein FliK
MIGTSFQASASPATAAMAAAEPPTAMNDAGTTSRADGDATTANGASRASSGKESAGSDAPAVNASKQRDADAQDRKTGDDASPREFADLLAANGAGDTAADAATKPAASAANASEPPATATLPDQLLALLSGAWATPLKPAPTAPASANPAGSPGTPTLQLPVATSAGTLPLALPAATPDVAKDAAGESFAALAKLAADALAGSESTDKPGAPTADAPSLPDGLALLATGPVAASARAGVLAPASTLAMPADPEAGFDDGFGTRIAWMAEQRLGHAEIRLNPEHVGPIDVRVQLDGNRVTAEFHSAHAEVRQAIEASMPRLREMLGQHGLQLGHADVGQRHAQGHTPSRNGLAGTARDRDGDDGVHTRSIAPLRSRGLLDEYA